jgi:LacI family transcriptional regulator
VAAAAGVSVATVSRALSGSRGVKPEHYDRVLATAKHLNYKPHQVAQALRKATTRTVGILVPAIDNPFFPRLITAVERELNARGFALLIASSNDDEEAEAARLEMLVERRVDGLLVSASTWHPQNRTLREVAAQVPVVLFDQLADGVPAPFVGTDDAGGMKLLIDHLAERGARTLAHIGAGDDNWSGFRRRSEFERLVLERPDLSLVCSRRGSFSREYGFRAATALLQERPDVDAITCGNDLIACGVLDAAEQLGIGVPDRLLVTGYDDINVATMCKPRLTTIRQPVDELMSTAVEMLMGLKSSADGAGVERYLPVELVVRDSSVRV